MSKPTDDTQLAAEMPERFKPESGFRAVFAAAYSGLLHTLSAQRNMKAHWISGFMVMIVGMALPLDLGARTALFFSVVLILFAEILNSALEAFVDLHIRAYHHQAKLAKDAAAAGVLVLSVAVVVLFADLIWRYKEEVAASTRAIVRSLSFGLPATLLLAAVLFLRLSQTLKLGALALCLGLLVPLVSASCDPFFSFTAVCFIIVGVHARLVFPAGTR